MKTNKVTYFGETLVDLTGDVVAQNMMFAGLTAYNASGEKISGTLFEDYPPVVVVPKIEPVEELPEGKSVSRVVFCGETIFDITDATINADNLLWGCHCHTKDGQVIRGEFLYGYPQTILFGSEMDQDILLDSEGDPLLDSFGNPLFSSYQKAGLIDQNYEPIVDQDGLQITGETYGILYRKTSETDTDVTYTRVS